VFFTVDPRLGTAADFAARLKKHGVLVGALGKQLIRAVTHLDVSPADIERAGTSLKAATAEAAAGARPAETARSAYA
jgi:threonine aldolase